MLTNPFLFGNYNFKYRFLSNGGKWSLSYKNYLEYSYFIRWVVFELHKARSIAHKQPLNILNLVGLPVSVFNNTKLLLPMSKATTFVSCRSVWFEVHITLYQLKSSYIKADLGILLRRVVKTDSVILSSLCR